VPANLYGMDREGLSRALEGHGARPFHGRQVYRWLYSRRAYAPESWTDLPRPLRQAVATEAVVDPGRILHRTVAGDGTVKALVGLADGKAVEAVSMEQRGRRTFCLSSQVGCALACDFCLTGRMGLKRHLSPGEIVGQLALLLDELGDPGEHDGPDARYNVVFMGMGEPLHNYEGVLAAFRLLTDPDGFALSRRRITVSTSGLVPAIERLAGEPERPRLAVSLNATTDAVRDRLMPINRRYPLDRLLAACRRFLETTGERFTFEYVLLAGVNDHDADVRRLQALLRRVPAKVNLIPFNPVPGLLDYRPPSRERVLELRDRLLQAGLPASIRWSRGAEARAACGQLALLPGDHAA
jgi:23S rRNA (adenine2503-C2)-methyltransferase